MGAGWDMLEGCSAYPSPLGPAAHSCSWLWSVAHEAEAGSSIAVAAVADDDAVAADGDETVADGFAD